MRYSRFEQWKFYRLQLTGWARNYSFAVMSPHLHGMSFSVCSPCQRELLTCVDPEYIFRVMKKGKNPLTLKRSSVLLVKGFVSQEGYYILAIMEKMKQRSSERQRG